MPGINTRKCCCGEPGPPPPPPCPFCAAGLPEVLSASFAGIDLISCGDLAHGSTPGIGNVELQPNDFSPGPYALVRGAIDVNGIFGSGPCIWNYSIPISGHRWIVHRSANCTLGIVRNDPLVLSISVQKISATEGSVGVRLGFNIFQAVFNWADCMAGVGGVPNANTQFFGAGAPAGVVYGRFGTMSFAPPVPPRPPSPPRPVGPQPAPAPVPRPVDPGQPGLDGAPSGGLPIADLTGYDPETSPDSPKRGSCCDPPKEQ